MFDKNKKSTLIDSEISLLSFFKENSEIRFCLGDNFKSWLLSEPCAYVNNITSSLQFIKNEMSLEEIKEKFNPKFYSVSQFLSFLHDNIVKQPKGEEGILLNNGLWNIFYINLEDDKNIIVFVHLSDSKRWHCIAVTSDYNMYFKGDCVFSCN